MNDKYPLHLSTQPSLGAARTSRRGFATALLGASVSAACIASDDLDDLFEEQQFRAGMTMPISVRKAQLDQGLVGYPAHCSISPDLQGLIGIGEQLRVWRSEEEYAVYTVKSIHPNDPPGTLRMARAGRQRLGVSSTFDGTLDMQVSLTVTSDEEEQAARDASEFVERLRGSFGESALICLAPHGGSIEAETDVQAELLAAYLGVGSWACKGWRSGGGAYERWHVTSTDFSPASFPCLAQLLDTLYERAVSFHGMAAPGVLVGGGATFEERSLIGASLSEALDGTGLPVAIADDDDELSGASPANLVNWLCQGRGIQLEQGPQVRSEYAELIVEALASSLAQLQ